MLRVPQTTPRESTPGTRGIARLAVLLSSAWMIGCSGHAAEGPPIAIMTSVNDLDGRPVVMSAPKGGALVLVFYSTECPISNAYSPTLHGLARRYSTQVRFVGVCVDPDLGHGEVVQHAREFGLAFPIVRDPVGRISRKFGVSMVPEVVVFDDRGQARYQGRIDDQFAARQKRNAVSQIHDLEDALVAVLSGRAVANPRVPAVGCPIPEPPRAAAAAPSFETHIRPLLKQHCQACHSPGQVAPFPLSTYEQARKRAGDLATVVESGLMPPWQPSRDFGPRFLHERGLNSREIATLVAWADAGSPRGAITPGADRSPEETPRVTSAFWELGQPDVILQPTSEFEVPASGPDLYQCFVLPSTICEDRYIEAVEIRPGNRSVVHHVFAYVDTTGEARRKDAAEPREGYPCLNGVGLLEVHGDLGGWAPGSSPHRALGGVGRLIPANADVVLQVHYHPSGKPERDRSQIGLYFAQEPVKQVLHWARIMDPQTLLIPAHQKDVEQRVSWKVPIDVEVRAVAPHMHWLGRQVEMFAVLPGGERRDLIRIPDWSFERHDFYYLAEPLELPKGTEVWIVGRFDNSADNPRNPHRPPRDVRWGPGTDEEMLLGFLGLTQKGVDLARPGARDELGALLRAEQTTKEKLKRQLLEKSPSRADQE